MTRWCRFQSAISSYSGGRPPVRAQAPRHHKVVEIGWCSAEHCHSRGMPDGRKTAQCNYREPAKEGRPWPALRPLGKGKQPPIGDTLDPAGSGGTRARDLRRTAIDGRLQSYRLRSRWLCCDVAGQRLRLRRALEPVSRPGIYDARTQGRLYRGLTDESGPVRAEGKLVSLGRCVAFAEARLVDSAGRLCASATSTLLVFDIDRPIA